jgi:hypothetical protein
MSDLDLTPEAVARLAADLQSVAAATGPNDAAAIAWSAAATLRVLSARLADREASETATIQWLRELKPKVQRIEAERDAAEAALATARADAALIAELVAAGNVMANALRGNYIVPGSAGKWFAALAKMNGAQP